MRPLAAHKGFRVQTVQEHESKSFHITYIKL